MKIRFILLSALMLISLSMSAQKYHDAQNEELKGHVKSMTYNDGNEITTVTFTEDGRTQFKDISNPLYDNNGYMQSCDYKFFGKSGRMKFYYNSDKYLDKQVLDVDGGTIIMDFSYNADHTIKSYTMTMSYNGMSQSMVVTYIYNKFDNHGNWISRTSTTGSQSLEEKRTIIYW